jgi:Lar family restriction alleviation protein
MSEPYDALKPCPFCGGSNVTVHVFEEGRGGGYDPWVAVMCDDCDIQGETHKTEEEAVEAWNRRA